MKVVESTLSMNPTYVGIWTKKHSKCVFLGELNDHSEKITDEIWNRL